MKRFLSIFICVALLCSLCVSASAEQLLQSPETVYRVTVPGFDSTAPTDPTVPTLTKPHHENNPNARANGPVNSTPLFLFGLLSVLVYLIFLLVRRKRMSGDMTPDGKIRRRAFLSKGAVAQAVKESMLTPPDKVDQAILDAIQKTEAPPSEN